MSGAFWGAADDAESIRVIHQALDLGVTLVDTAEAYGRGHSEEVVGKALAGRREKAVIAEAVTSGLPFWGVCLGAQLLAASLGTISSNHGGLLELARAILNSPRSDDPRIPLMSRSD